MALVATLVGTGGSPGCSPGCSPAPFREHGRLSHPVFGRGGKQSHASFASLHCRQVPLTAVVPALVGLSLLTLHGVRRRQPHRKTPAKLQALRQLNEGQRKFWQTLDRMWNDEFLAAFPKETVGRVYEFMEYCKYERPIPKLPDHQECDPEYFPGLRAQPWWDKADCGDWLKKVEEGLPYVQGELATLLEENERLLIADSVSNDVMGAGWTGFRLQRLGSWLPKNCAQFPQTIQLLKEAGTPLASRGVLVARQMPRTGVAPHSDGRNCFLTAHFGLSVPEQCSITVGGVTRNWEEDGAVVFDTSFTHSTQNDSEEDRFVLIVDFWHPDLTQNEREALEYIYSCRTMWEQGKVQWKPEGFFETLEHYSAWGGAYTEEKNGLLSNSASTDFGGFKM